MAGPNLPTAITAGVTPGHVTHTITVHQMVNKLDTATGTSGQPLVWNGTTYAATDLSADRVADGTTNHVFTAADDTKLSTITTGANQIIVRWTGSAWGARPSGSTFGVVYLSTNDPAATAPTAAGNGLVTGDLWRRHPDAAPLT